MGFKNLKTFALFESRKENLPFKLSKGVSKMKDLPEFKTMMDVLYDGKTRPIMFSEKDGTWKIYSTTYSTITISPEGLIEYNKYEISPVDDIPIETWTDAFDFITFYIIMLQLQKVITGWIGTFGRFVYKGESIPASIIKKTATAKNFHILLEMAIKKNGKNGIACLEDILKISKELLAEEIEKGQVHDKANQQKIISLLNVLKNSQYADDAVEIVSEAVLKTPSLMGAIENVSKKIYDDVLKKLGWDKMGDDMLRQIKDGIY